MSPYPYATWQNIPLADNATLMLIIDLQSHIIHANDTPMQISGYALQGLQGQPHNMARHLDMPKAALADMWFTLRKGEPWSSIARNRRKNSDHYWARADAVPMVREGEISGYISTRTRAANEEVAAVKSPHKALNAGRTSKRVRKGLVVRKGRLGKLPSSPLRWRVRRVMTLMFIVLATILWLAAALIVTHFLYVLVVLLGNAYSEWQIVRPIENVASQVLKAVIGEHSSAEHLKRSNEPGLTLRAVGQLGLMHHRSTDDVSSQMSSVKDGSEALAKGIDELSGHIQQTIDNTQQTMATTNQMAASVKQNSATASAADRFSITANNAVVQGGEAMTTVIKTMDDTAGGTQRIGTITLLINDIALQTNILALSVAVEAARASEQGKGFVVVAGEVRHLASRSVSAANDTRKSIDTSADKVQSGSRQVYAAGWTMEDTMAQVKNVTQLIVQISHSTLERADGLSSLTRVVDEFSLITQKSTELVGESAQASVVVKHRTSRLEGVVTVLHRPVCRIQWSERNA